VARFLQSIYTYLVTSYNYLVTTILKHINDYLLGRISLYQGNKINNAITIFFIGIIIGWVLSYYHTLRQCGYVL
jgi:hypothetical protein